jgi:parallel beta-helix repeat protein
MKRSLSILFALALVVGLSLVATTPAAAATINVPGDYATIQAAVGNASGGDTIMVAAGTYAGAIVDKQLTIVGASGGGSVITSGVAYKSGGAYTTAFRLDAGADGTQIRNFTIQCNAGSSFYFGVFSRGVDDVTIDGLTVDDAVQGITSWGGSGWVITNNGLADTVAAGGGGIAIFLGAMPGNVYPSYQVCQGNLVEHNTMSSYSTEAGYTSPGICLALDIRGFSIPGDLSGSEDVSNNRMVGNTFIGTGNANEVGIEIGVIGAGGDSAKTAATMGIIHDNSVEDNTIDGSDLGLYLYVVQNLTVTGNNITNCVTHGVSIWDDFTGAIHSNSIAGNAYGLYNDVSSITVDARYNWWGDNSGPYNASLNSGGTGDDVSNNVDFQPWTSETTPATGGTAYFTPDAGTITGLTGVAAPAGAPVSFPYGMFSFVVTGISGQVTLTIELPGPMPVGSVWYKYNGGSWDSLPIGSNDGDNIITVTLRDNVSPDDEDLILTQITDQGGPAPGAVGWETYPVSKARVLLPWIALLAAIAAGASLLVLRRRRTQS